MKQLVIFDLDGTLLNTIADLGEATNHALKQCGYPQHALDSYKMMVGNGIGKLLERAMPDYARTPGNVAKLRACFTDYYDRHNTDLTVPYQGIPELLDKLNDMGVKLAVASNKYQCAVTKLITHYFPHLPWVAIHGNRDCIPTKPDPSIVFNILGSVPTPKTDVLYVGDSGVDMETARRACIESAGVTWGFRPESELIEHHAEHIVHEPIELLELIKRPLQQD
ncbi:MAG: HAD family hydrolase [Muribaculaceae bacterium]|nr:HAD family hydrolase [Muribaculaceae bacterium]